MPTRFASLYSYSVILMWGLLVALVFGFNLLHLRLYLQSWPSVCERFLLPLLAMAAILLAVRSALGSRLMVANVLIAITAALYAEEFYIASYIDSGRGAGQASQGEFDHRDKLSVISDLRHEGVDAYPVMRGKNMLLPDKRGDLQPILSVAGRPLLPLASLPDTMVVSCNEVGQWQIYRTDRHGFNNPDGQWDAKRPTIGMVGDSFAHGSCVPEQQNMAAVLRAHFAGVINLGVGGSGPLLELAALTEYLPPLRPPVVLWVFFEGNDLTEDLPFERRSPLLNAYLRDDDFRQGLIARDHDIAVAMRPYLDQNLIAAMNRVDDPFEDTARYLSLDRVRELVGLGPLQIGLNSGDLGDEVDLFEQVLRKARDRVRAWGGRFYLVYLPESDRYLSRFGESSVRQTIYRGVSAVARRADIPMIDVATTFSHDPSPATLYAYPGAHFNAKGYRVAAEAIREALEHDAR
jgi:lysophospholipase L1-like esterase